MHCRLPIAADHLGLSKQILEASSFIITRAKSLYVDDFKIKIPK